MEYQPSKSPATSERRQREERFQSNIISQIIHKGLTDLFHAEQCTDFEIIAGGVAFKCHKVVLAAISDYFKAMFESGMKESVQNQAEFDDLSPKVFGIIFEILYPKDEEADVFEKATEEEISELLRVADMLHMKVLVEKCCDYFKTSMSPTNCVGRWKLAKLIMNEEITNYAWQFLLRNFQYVLSGDTLMYLQFEEFRMIIKDVNLVCESEYMVWIALIQWIIFDKANRKQHMSDLLNECCLTELGEDLLTEEVACDPIVQSDDDASKLVLRAIQYIRNPLERNSMEIKLRNYMDKDQMLVLIGRKQHERKNEHSLVPKESYTKVEAILISHRRQKISKIGSPMNEPVAFCAIDSNLYVTSGKSMSIYFPDEVQWKDLQPLPFPLQNQTMVASEDGIYVIGGSSGFSQNSQVLRYDMQGKSWNVVGQVLISVSHASSVYAGNKIYVFGGMDGGDEAVNSVQEYDTLNNVSSIVCNLPNPCPYSRAERRGDDVYIVTCHGDVVHFSTKYKKVDLIASFPDFKRYHFGIEMRSNTLSVYGGCRSRQNTLCEEGSPADEFVTTILSVDVISGNILPPEQFQFPMEVFGCASVVMSTKLIRRLFLDRLFSFLEEKGSPVTSEPVICKEPIDLYNLYIFVQDRGGMVEVTKLKKWKEVCGLLNISESASTAFTLKRIYIKYLLGFECRYDRNNIDSNLVLSQMEADFEMRRLARNMHRVPLPGLSRSSQDDI